MQCGDKWIHFVNVCYNKILGNKKKGELFLSLLGIWLYVSDTWEKSVIYQKHKVDIYNFDSIGYVSIYKNLQNLHGG